MAETKSPFPEHEDPEYWRQRQREEDEHNAFLDEQLKHYDAPMPAEAAEALIEFIKTRPPASGLPPRRPITEKEGARMAEIIDADAPASPPQPRRPREDKTE